MNAEVFEQEIQKSTTYGACDGSSWHRSAAAEGRWGILTKCGVTEYVTDRRSHDGPFCWFVIKIREVVPVPKFQEFMCFGMETLDRLLCL